MTDKTKCIVKYILLRALPFFLTLASVSAAFMYMAYLETDPLYIPLTVLCTAAALGTAVYYAARITRFAKMISESERRYGTVFEMNGYRTFDFFDEWIICTDNWLIRMGKYAVYRKEIVNAAVGECLIGKGGARYPLRIKTRSTKTLVFTFRDPDDANEVKKWARSSYAYTPNK
ncbi:MAG: hypothetical protein IJN63_10500 [Clostridia bacterium]|nr:hypothetical protein [Clostridia bacterium]